MIISHVGIIPATAISYRVVAGDGDALADALRSAGWAAIETRNRTEAHRLRSPEGGLVVIYHSGSVLAQGTPGVATQALAAFVVAVSPQGAPGAAI